MLRTLAHRVVVLTVVSCATGGIVGCLDRPVTAAAPTIKTNFTEAVSQSSISKIDILFDIDNSASMGDKQQYLIQAVPQMITRLVTPRCVDAKGVASGANADVAGQCAAGTSPEFPPIHDMHIGVVTSALGSRGGDVCTASGAGAAIPIVGNGGNEISRYLDDQAHLINRIPATSLPGGASDAAVPMADYEGGAPPILADPGLPTAALPEGGGFLNWFPAEGNMGKTTTTPPSVVTASTDLVASFSELIGGAGESGCGIESQLESWYRFLVQPDPYLTISGGSQWVGVDTVILQQRHDFLRPDSLVAVVVLSDENDSEIDARSLGGTGVLFLENTPSSLPHGTSICATNPNDPKCTICPQNLAGNPCDSASPPAACNDPACLAEPAYTETPANSADWGYDSNLRHVHMKQKYGVDPQYPLLRYFLGLTSTKVPNRVGEYPAPGSYTLGNNNCANPLFAGTLPQAADVPDATQTTPAEIATTLCNVSAAGTATRTAADVFFAHIGGVPHQLLQTTPGNGCDAGDAADCPQKDTLSFDAGDWTKILGSGPAAFAAAVNGNPTAVSPVGPDGGAIDIYDYTGIDPHMIESQSPRNQIPSPDAGKVGDASVQGYSTPNSNPPVSTLSGPAFGNGADPVRPDPINGREFITNQGFHSGLAVDREYACIFPLPTALQRDCAQLNPGGTEFFSCDCEPNPDGGDNLPGQQSPLCSTPSGSSHYTLQTHAKAYPTTRELTLAAMMGDQGIVSSLCPIHTDDNLAGDDPLYGYRPAVNAIVDRLKSRLGPQCVLPLSANGDGTVPCLVLVSFGPTSNGPASTASCSTYGGGAYSDVPADALKSFNERSMAASGDAGALDLANEVTCQLNQVPILTDGGTCVGNSTKPGWCYVSGAGVGASSCSQQISISDPSIVPSGATISLECVAAE